MSQYKYFKSGIINRSSQYQKTTTKKTQVITNRFIDFIFVNCCVKIKKKHFCWWKFSNVLLAKEKYYTTYIDTK